LKLENSVFVIFCDFRLQSTFKEWILAEITGDRPRHGAHEIKRILSRVLWALAQISCWFTSTLVAYFLAFIFHKVV